MRMESLIDASLFPPRVACSPIGGLYVVRVDFSVHVDVS